jgi:MFS family permease
VTYFFAITNLAGVFSAVLSYGISYMDGLGGLSAWRWVFLLEGLFTILFAGVVWYALPDYPQSPKSNRWFTVKEQEFLSARLTENQAQTGEKNFDWNQIKASLRDPKLWTFMLLQVLLHISIANSRV